MPARIGNFTGGSGSFGTPLSIVHPTDNSFVEAQYFPDLLAEPGLTPAERDQLQLEYEQLLAALQLGRDYFGNDAP